MTRADYLHRYRASSTFRRARRREAWAVVQTYVLGITAALAVAGLLIWAAAELATRLPIMTD